MPLKIQGPLMPGNIKVDGSLSSQFLTGLLMAYGAANAKDVSIKVKDLKSKPYIDLTLEVMNHFGWSVENKNYEEFYFPFSSTVNSQLSTVNYTVEGDWSGAAFLLVAGAIAGDIHIKGLNVYSTQADKAIVQALMSCGANISIEDNEINIGSGSLRSFHFDATDCPDLFPPLVALASYCEGTTVIEGVKRLAHKESNRSLTLQEEFAKMGITIELQGNRMRISGGKGVKSATVHSHHDHRIAMACAVAGLKAGGETIIVDAEAINKSYPEFYKHLQSLGVTISMEHPSLNAL